MSSLVNVLIAVDVEGALTTNNLGANVYMVDTNKYAGSGAEGTSELRTKLEINHVLYWTVASIDPGATVTISSFAGDAVTNKYIQPVQDPLSPASWEARFNAPGSASDGDKYQYTMTLSFEGTTMTFDPYLVVKK